MWYELIPAPRHVDADEDDGFLTRAKRAADAIGLSGRPGWFDWWKHDDGCRIVAHRGRRWVEISDRYGLEAARVFATACDATVRPLDHEPDVLTKPKVWAHAFVPKTAILTRTARDTGSGADAARLDMGVDTVVVVNVRRFGWVESMRNTDWIGDEFNMQADSSKLRGEGVGACRVMAGAPDSQAAMDGARRAASSLDLGLVPGLSSHVSRPGLGFMLIMLPLQLLLTFPLILPWWPVWIPLLSLPFTVGSIIRWWLKHDSSNDVDQRPRHWWYVARTRHARSGDMKTKSAGDDGDARTKKRVKAYAFQRSTMPLPPGALAAICRPDANRTATVAVLDRMPQALENCDGPVLGSDVDGRPVRMSKDAMYGGVFLMGEPGGGKSNMMHGVCGWMTGRHHTGDVLVDLESKGGDSIPILKRFMPDALIIDVNDPNTPMIDLLGAGSPAERADRFATLMQSALGVQQVGPQSRIQLRDAVYVALNAIPMSGFDARCRSMGVDRPKDWVACAARLLARDGVRDARALGHACTLACDDPDVTAAVERLHGGVTDRGTPKIRDGELAQLLRAPMNKMDLLASAPWLASGRPLVSWDRIIRRSDTHPDARLIVNLGAALKPDEDGRHRDLPDGTRRLVGALLFRGLKDEIVASCMGWQTKGRAFRLLIDETTDVLGADGADTGGNADILAWLREKGRAYGVQLVAGTQNTTQLDGELLASVTGLMTVGTFVLRTDLTAVPAAAAVGGNPATVKSLPRHAILIRTVGPPPQVAGLPALTLMVPHFDGGAPV
ncbi:hypothetical protein [Bifidobacterium felsineum]|uniref:hypothetical protein n=1 Tax=Bifidobacterium felsineum TaxID=2045440 RepID=UPI001BDC7CFA|nr:hypothetical protein [Bifidobacterium felsineum]MBT1164558.1 hypothetical protein [Bifidobacterium felsineum]